MGRQDSRQQGLGWLGSAIRGIPQASRIPGSQLFISNLSDPGQAQGRRVRREQPRAQRRRPRGTCTCNISSKSEPCCFVRSPVCPPLVPTGLRGFLLGERRGRRDPQCRTQHRNEGRSHVVPPLSLNALPRRPARRRAIIDGAPAKQSVSGFLHWAGSPVHPPTAGVHDRILPSVSRCGPSATVESASRSSGRLRPTFFF
jgi:hypothetical protein